MKTVLYADLIQCKSMLRALGPMLGIVVVVSLINFGRGTMPTLMFTMMLLMLVYMLFSYDEKANWTRYLLTLPIRPFGIVAARYLLVVIGFVLSAVFCGIMVLVQVALGNPQNVADIVYTFFIALLPFLVSYSISFPIMYQIGVEKARLLSALVFIVPFFVVFFSLFYFGDGPSSADFITRLLPIAAPVALALFCASLFVSVHVVKRKEW